jgi:hypothetical protein
LHKKCAAEAELARLNEECERLRKCGVKESSHEFEDATLAMEAAAARVRDATLDASALQNLANRDKHKGMLGLTKDFYKTEMSTQRLLDDVKRRHDIFNKALRSKDYHELLKGVQSLHSAHVGAELAAITSRLRVFYLLVFLYNSGKELGQSRTRAKLNRSIVSRVTKTLVTKLPAEVIKAKDFLQESVSIVPRSERGRDRERTPGWLRGARAPVKQIAQAKEDRVPIGLLKVTVDMFTTKGQKTTSSFPFANLFKRMCRLIHSTPLSRRVTVLIENGYRSSRQAAGLISYLGNLSRADHRSVKATDVEHPWQAPLVGAFKWFFCPVTKTILKRDPPAALSMVVIGTASLHDAPRFQNFLPKSSD